jgi:hypothetical protein
MSASTSEQSTPQQSILQLGVPFTMSIRDIIEHLEQAKVEAEKKPSRKSLKRNSIKSLALGRLLGTG